MFSSLKSGYKGPALGLLQGLHQKLFAPRNFAWIITEVCSWITQPLPLPFHSPGDPLSVKVRSCPFSAQNPPLAPTHSEEQPESYNSLQDLHGQTPGGSQDSPPLLANCSSHTGSRVSPTLCLLQPRGLCTCCLLCLEGSSPGSDGSSPPLLWFSGQRSPSS